MVMEGDTDTPDKKKKAWRVVASPDILAKMVLAACPQNLFDAGAVKRAFPNLRMSVEKIKNFMDTSEYIETCRNLAGVDKRQLGVMYDNIVKREYDNAMTTGKLNIKFLEHLGIASGKYVPKIDVTNRVRPLDQKNLNAFREMVRATRDEE